MFNKFAILKMHTLVTRTEMERQDAPLTVNDFQAMLLVMRSLDGFAFFNRGFKSGMSVLHKHFQIVPYASMM